MPNSTTPPDSVAGFDKSRVAAERFARANQVAGCGDYDYAIQLLLDCCKLEPANLVYRHMLRRTQKLRFDNNLRGSPMAGLQNLMPHTRLKAALRARDFERALEIGEQILVRNPWDLRTQMEMAEAAEALGMLDVAIWLLEQARHRDSRVTHLSRALARLYEKRGNFAAAIALWEQVAHAEPHDLEARHKPKALAASETISRGRFGQDGSPVEMPIASIGDTKDSVHPDKTPLAPFHDRVNREATPWMARIEASPEEPNAYLELARVYARDGQRDAAREILVRGHEATHEDLQIRIALLEFDLEAARAEMLELQAEVPTEDELEERQRVKQRLEESIAEAEIELYRLKIEQSPHELSHRIELGLRLRQAGELDEAIMQLQMARKDVRQQWRALMYLGLCFLDKKNWTLARRNLEESLDQMPASEELQRLELLFRLATGHAAAGDFGAALEVGHELANHDFNYRHIGQLLDQWQKSDRE